MPENDYASQKDSKNDKKGSKKKNDKQRLLYKCTDKCVLLDDSEIDQLTGLLEEAAKCPDDAAENWMRVFVMKHVECSNYKIYDDATGAVLDPERMYLFACQARNHPLDCYAVGVGRCRATEVTVRKAMVHYENMRKLHRILTEAVKAHRLLADLDAAIALRDLNYLSKLIRIQLGKPPS